MIWLFVDESLYLHIQTLGSVCHLNCSILAIDIIIQKLARGLDDIRQMEQSFQSTSLAYCLHLNIFLEFRIMHQLSADNYH